MAKKAAGKSAQHTNPSGKRLGVKVSDGVKVNAGAILVRQSGTKIAAGDNVKVGRDYTLYAKDAGTVRFIVRLGKKIVKVVS